MRMIYGGFLPCSGSFTDRKTGKEINWKNLRVLLSTNGNPGLYKAPFSDAFLDLFKALPLGSEVDVCFDFYGKIEGFAAVEGGGNHA